MSEGKKGEAVEVAAAAPSAEVTPLDAAMDWSSLSFLTGVKAIPEKTDATKKECWLFRGKENWLGRFDRAADEAERAESVRQEVRALFSKWLQIENVSLLMGAGCSLYVTKFVTSGLWDVIKKALEKRPTSKSLVAIEGMAKSASTLGRDFESLLSQLSAIRALAASQNWPIAGAETSIPFPDVADTAQRTKLLSDLLDDIERAIVIGCNVKLPISNLSAQSDQLAEYEVTPHEALFSKLVARNPQLPRAKIFTPNYDLLIEQALERLGIHYVDGFSGNIERRFSPWTYDLDMHHAADASEGRVRRYDRVLHLHKLHGSINWRRVPLGSGANPYGIAFDSRPLASMGDLAKAADDDRNRLFEGTFDPGQGLAILPTASKFGESLTMPYAHLFRAFSVALHTTQTILFVIGYGGWDAHINALIEDALTNSSFTCVIVDPYPSKWAVSLCKADASGRVYCMGGEWAKFENFAPDVLPDLEVLKTELAIAHTLRDLRRFKEADKKADGV